MSKFALFIHGIINKIFWGESTPPRRYDIQTGLRTRYDR